MKQRSLVILDGRLQGGGTRCWWHRQGLTAVIEDWSVANTPDRPRCSLRTWNEEKKKRQVVKERNRNPLQKIKPVVRKAAVLPGKPKEDRRGNAS